MPPSEQWRTQKGWEGGKMDTSCLLKTSESQFSVTPAEEIEDLTPQSAMLSYGGVSCGSLPNHTAKSTNGSIITMTLKNNHLIVETEERGVGVPGGATKTTTTKFTASSSPDENNVFVVEVQQTPLYPSGGSQEDLSSQMAQVHHPPEADSELEDHEEEEEEGRMTKCGSTNTGLSQSDLSVSSAGSNNPSYRYGNQVGYEGGHFGYPQDVGYTIADDAPGVTDKLPAVQMGGVQTERRRHDVEDDSIQEEQRRLGQGSTPEQGIHNGDEILMIDDEVEDSGTTKKGGKEVFSKTDADLAPEGKHLAAKKRGSLPIITPELYKQTKNLIIDKTTSRPVKFEKLSNETSPLDDARRGQGDAGAPRGMEVIPETADGKPGLEYENPGSATSPAPSPELLMTVVPVTKLTGP
uniref:Uncharacterized protein n=1 Tax=Timema monikensis TaxID=170555 RepID=A0A7R9HS31_9NEOP|nr:unnamed protein product [Timema monikensis]